MKTETIWHAATGMLRHAKTTPTSAHKGRTLITLLMMLLTTATAGAQTTESVKYIDENGETQTVDAMVLDGSVNTLSQGWYVVSSDVSYEKLFINSDANIILKDNCTMTVSRDADAPIVMSYNLTIYGQSGGTGKLVVNTSNLCAIAGGVYTFTVNGGIVESKSTNNYGYGLICGSLVFNGGKLKLEGCDGVKGKSNTSQSVTLNWRSTTDRVYISGFNNISSVTVGGAGGKYFVDGSGNSYVGTYTSNFSSLAGKELQPATAYTLNLGSGVTTTTEPLFTNSDVDYYAGTVTLGYSGTVPDGYLFGGYTVNGAAIDGNTFSITADATVAAAFTPDPAHFSVSGDEYTIHTAEGWGVFCDALQDNDTYNRFSGKTVKLDANIGTAQDPITRMAGSSKHDFCGTFDGGGNTLTVKYGTSGTPASVQNIAPFSYVSNVENGPATIKNLHVVGHIYTSAKYAAGIVGQHWGTLNIKNCRSSVVIHSSTSGDGTHGGIEGASNGALNIEGCVFDGKLLSKNTGNDATTLCGGFVGYGTCTITNSLYAPAGLGDGETEITNGSCTFVRNATPGTNCYYTRLLGTEQGKAPRTITGGEGVTIEAISPVGSPVENGTYSVSGITAYAKGITRTVGQTTTFYYGNEDQVSLTLSHTEREGYSCAYTASGGTLTGNDNPYTLTMPDADVIIRAVYTKLPVSTSYVDADGTLHENIEAVPLDATMTTLAAGTYVVNSNISYTGTVTLSGDVNLILADGCTMNVGTSESRINGNGIDASGIGNVLTIYGQSAGSGKLNVYVTGDFNYGINIYDAYVQHGGIVNIESSSNSIFARGEYDNAHYYFVSGSVTVDGGKLTVTSSNNAGIFAAWDIAITGGEVSATSNAKGYNGIFTYGNITLGWTNPTDRIYVSSLYASNQWYGGNVSIKSGQKLTDGTNIYTDATESTTLEALTTTTLYPYIENLNLAANAHDGNYWTTFYCGHTGYKINDGENAWAYTATVSGNELTLHKLGKVIPKQTAVILVGDDNSISMTASTTAAENTVSNELKGEDVRTSLDDIKTTRGNGTFYVMGKVNGDFGFFQYKAQYMPARKAYLLVDGDALANGLKMVFDNETTSLTPVPSPKGEGSDYWYTLSGTRLSAKPTQPGLYIHNSKKVVIK